MRYSGHYHEHLSAALKKLFRRRGAHDLKVDLWNAFVDSGLVGINDDDVSILPRILPLSYLPTIETTCYDLTEFLMKFLSLPTRELERVLIPTPITTYVMRQLGVLEHRQKRMTGSLRFDFAVEGPPVAGNIPKLLEINDIGFDGGGRSAFIQKTILQLFPELKKRVRCFDTAASEVSNMRRLGKHLMRIQYDDYNWEEEVLVHAAKRVGLDLSLVSPASFGVEVDDEEHPLLKRVPQISRTDAFQIGFSFDLDDYKEGRDLYRKLIRSRMPQYSPFITALFSPKSILVTLEEKDLQRRLLGERRAKRMNETLVGAWLFKGHEEDLKKRFHERVIKFTDGMGGEQVYLGKHALSRAVRISKRKRNEWVVQKRIKLNTIDVHGFLSRPRMVICDLSAYVQYDWNGKQFTNFRVGGFITRATNRSLKVNVSGGGLQVPVMFDRSR